jgi:arsenical pump membrane protein
VTRGVSWDVLGFLVAAFILAQGLRSAGVVARLAELYDGAGAGTVGVASALGSAAINNHPMAIMNLLALSDAGAGRDHVLAALIGGDLGPRLLPTGSLAGLLWIASLRRLGVDLPLRRFIVVGVAVTIPTLALSLALLGLL